MKKLFILITLSLLFIFSTGVPLYAAEGGEASPFDFVYKVINFVVLFGLLYYFARKPFSQGLRDSAESTKNELEEARENQKRAEEELNVFRDKLKNMKQEAEQMVLDAKKDAEAEKERIIKEGEEFAEKLKDQVRVSIEQEYNKASLELKKWAAGETVKLAEEKIKQDMKESHQDSLFSNYLNKLN